jgi:hypothetical protein
MSPSAGSAPCCRSETRQEHCEHCVLCVLARTSAREYLVSRCAKVIKDFVEASASRIASRASDEVASSDFLPKASLGTLDLLGPFS